MMRISRLSGKDQTTLFASPITKVLVALTLTLMLGGLVYDHLRTGQKREQLHERTTLWCASEETELDQATCLAHLEAHHIDCIRLTAYSSSSGELRGRGTAWNADWEDNHPLVELPKYRRCIELGLAGYKEELRDKAEARRQQQRQRYAP